MKLNFPPNLVFVGDVAVDQCKVCSRPGLPYEPACTFVPVIIDIKTDHLGEPEELTAHSKIKSFLCSTDGSHSGTIKVVYIQIGHMEEPYELTSHNLK